MKKRCFTVLLAVLLVWLPANALVHEQWNHRLINPSHLSSTPCGVGVDSAGNIYVAGKTSNYYTNTNIVIFKYTPQGTLSWRVTYDGPVGGNDAAAALVVDNSANVYVTGYSAGIGSGSDFVTFKYNSQGQLQWMARFNGPANGSDYAQVIALDDQGNVYVTGVALVSGSYGDFATIKYNSRGVQQWVAYYNGPANSLDDPSDVAVDEAGNVYVTGMSSALPSPSVNDDYATVKYNSQGVQQWVNRYDAPVHGQDWPCGLALDQQGNVYVSGFEAISVGLYDCDIATIKYNPAGAQLWLRHYNNPNYNGERADDIELDAEGNVILTGGVEGPSVPQHSLLTLKYDANGSMLWDRFYYAGWGGFSPGLLDVKVDNQNNIYATGQIGLQNGAGECVTLKYNSQGEQQWAAHHVCDSLQDDGGTTGTALALDNDGNVVVEGTFCFGGEIYNTDFFTVKYNQTSGNVTAAMIPSISPIVIPAQGGRFTYTVLTANYAQNNLALDYWWKALYPASNYLTPIPGLIQTTVPLDTSSFARTQRIPGNAPAGTYQYLLFTGEYPGMIWAMDTLTITKLTSGDGSLVTEKTEEFHLSSFVLHPCSPNPFNASTIITFTIPQASPVSLTIHNIQGRLIATLVNAWRQEGTHQITFDGSRLPSGVYLYTLKTGNFVSTQKMLLLK